MIRFAIILNIFLGNISCGSVRAIDNKPDNITDSTAIEFFDDFSKIDLNWSFKYGVWNYANEGVNQFLQHESNEPYGVAIMNQHIFTDVDVKVRFRPIDGITDQTGGIIFRVTDENNYYLVRANGLENNFRFYKTINGVRQELSGSAVNKPAHHQWHTLRIIMNRNHMQAWLDEQMFLDTYDDTLLSGYVGLWTKADSKTDFDDLSIKGITK